MGPEKSAAVNNQNHSEQIKRPQEKENLDKHTCYITKIHFSSGCMYIVDPADLVTFSESV